MLGSSYLSARDKTGGCSTNSAVWTKARMVRVLSAKLKALVIQDQACRVECIRHANGTVWFTGEPFGLPLAFKPFNIVNP